MDIKAPNLPNIVSAGSSVNLLVTFRQSGVEKLLLLEGVDPRPLYQGAQTSTQNRIAAASAQADRVTSIGIRLSNVSSLAATAAVGVPSSVFTRLSNTSAKITSVNTQFNGFRTSIRTRINAVSVIAAAGGGGGVPSSVYARLSGVSARLVTVSAKGTSVRTRLATASAKITSVNSQFDGFRTSTRTRLIAVSAKATSINSQFDGFRTSTRTRLTTVSGKVTSITTRFALASAKITSINSQFNGFRTSIRTRINAVSVLAAAGGGGGVPSSVYARLSGVSARLVTVSAKGTSVRTRLATVSAKGTSVRTQLQNLSVKLSNVSVAMVLGDSALETLANAILFRTHAISAQLSNVSVLATAVGSGVPASVFQRISAVSARAVSIRTRLATVSGKVTSITTRFATASAKITSVNSQFNGFRTSIRTRINSVSALAAAGGGGPVIQHRRLVSRFATSSNVGVDVSGMVFNVSANRVYILDLYGAVFTSITTNGGAVFVSAPTSSNLSGWFIAPNSATASNHITQRENGSPSSNVGSIVYQLEPAACGGRWIVATENTAGTIRLRIRSEASGTNFWLYEGAVLRMEKLV